ncbi:hypothetical protein LCGC14_1300500 [marine sediment metagenome]|uniref:Uncharacterized protein n=1 Tax=marine sediment metagenome TaxID=412755 RepID=A0A0F9KQ71_9ZZZZ
MGVGVGDIAFYHAKLLRNNYDENINIRSVEGLNNFEIIKCLYVADLEP